MIELKDICFAYDKIPVLRHIDLRIEDGKTVILQGPNGCGKSTLIKILNGLAFAERGEFLFDGNQITEQQMKKEVFAKKFHQQIGYVFQNPDVQLFCASVEEEIAFAPMQMGLDKEKVEQRVEDALKLLQIQELRKRPPYYLSTGEKKKVAIASILSMNPKVLILDEPLSGLDEESQEWLTSFLLQLKQAGKTMIVATHNHVFAETIADEIVKMNRVHEIECVNAVKKE